jgi:hypothetical protein
MAVVASCSDVGSVAHVQDDTQGLSRVAGKDNTVRCRATCRRAACLACAAHRQPLSPVTSFWEAVMSVRSHVDGESAAARALKKFDVRVTGVPARAE